MDLYAYIDRIEDAFDDPDVLRQIRDDARADQSLDPDDRQLILERAGTYLADARRAENPAADIDTVDDEEDDGAAAE